LSAGVESCAKAMLVAQQIAKDKSNNFFIIGYIIECKAAIILLLDINYSIYQYDSYKGVW
jgi:hypothetical protein